MAVIVQPYCEEESTKTGCTENQYKAGIALVKQAIYDMSNVDAREIAVTANTEYRSWYRLKVKNAPASEYRAIIEITETDALIHVILPRSSRTYAEVEKLWKKHRTLIETSEDDE